MNEGGDGEERSPGAAESLGEEGVGGGEIPVAQCERRASLPCNAAERPDEGEVPLRLVTLAPVEHDIGEVAVVAAIEDGLPRRRFLGKAGDPPCAAGCGDLQRAVEVDVPARDDGEVERAPGPVAMKRGEFARARRREPDPVALDPCDGDHPVDIAVGRGEIEHPVEDDRGDLGVRRALAEGGEKRRGQHPVADEVELDHEDPPVVPEFAPAAAEARHLAAREGPDMEAGPLAGVGQPERPAG